EGVTTFLEIGPDGVLCSMGQGCLSDGAQAGAVFLPALRKDRPDAVALAAAIGGAHVHNHLVDWSAFFNMGRDSASAGPSAPFRPHPIDLPTYAFQRERFWIESPKRRSAHATSRSAGESHQSTIESIRYRVVWKP